MARFAYACCSAKSQEQQRESDPQLSNQGTHQAAGRLTTHVLDTAQGRPGAGIAVRLFRVSAEREEITQTRTNADGRCDAPLLNGDAMEAGTFELEFDAGDYFASAGIALSEPRFLDTVVIRFGIADPGAHYHVPLLISPYGYSTYRGS